MRDGPRGGQDSGPPPRALCAPTHQGCGRNHFLNFCARHTVIYGEAACCCQVIDFCAPGTAEQGSRVLSFPPFLDSCQATLFPRSLPRRAAGSSECPAVPVDHSWPTGCLNRCQERGRKGSSGTHRGSPSLLGGLLALGACRLWGPQLLGDDGCVQRQAQLKLRLLPCPAAPSVPQAAGWQVSPQTWVHILVLPAGLGQHLHLSASVSGSVKWGNIVAAASKG